MTAREILFLVVAAAVAVGSVVLAPTSPRDGGEGVRPVDWAKVGEDRGKWLDISWMGVPVYPGAKKGTWIERMVEERFKVHLTPMLLGAEAYNERRSLMFASGQVSDVVWDGDPLGFRANVNHELVMELPHEVILKHAPNYVKQLNRGGPQAWLYSYCGGRNYGIPTFAASDVFPVMMVWRMDWLRNVGFDHVPDTLEEMEEAFRRFRNNDPDRNGKRDTYGVCPGLHYSITLIEVFAAYNTLPQDFVMREGKVVWGGVLPEAKAALERLRRWYREELIDPDYVTATGSEALDQTKFLNGRTGFLPYAGDERVVDAEYPNSLHAKLRAINQAQRAKGQTGTEARLVAGAPPRGMVDPHNRYLDGKRRYRFWGGPAHVIWFGRHVRGEPEKVLRVLHMFEEFSKPENGRLFVESRIGKQGLHWDWDARRGVVPRAPFDLPGRDAREMLLFWGYENAYGYYSPCSAPLEVTDPYLTESVRSVRREFRKSEWGLMNAIGKSDVVPSASRYLTDLRDYQSEAYTEIIRGEKPLEYFDTFVAEWNRRGGAVLTREANEVYRTLNEILRTVGGKEVR